jgi:serine/threonine protein kinase
LTLTLGSRIGSYEVTALLGKGGMGKVWRAHHTALKRDDALNHRDPSTENEGMWRLVTGVAGVVGVVIVAVHIRRRAAARKDIELGAVSQIWVAEHRGGTINTFHSTTAER